MFASPAEGAVCVASLSAGCTAMGVPQGGAVSANGGCPEEQLTVNWSSALLMQLISSWFVSFTMHRIYVNNTLHTSIMNWCIHTSRSIHYGLIPE